jgi:hypothetical protein
LFLLKTRPIFYMNIISVKVVWRKLILFDCFKKKFIFGENILQNHRPEFLYVFKRIQNGEPRTTNSFDGYYGHLNNVCETSNPTLTL